MLRTRILAAATATLLALGMAAGGASPALANGNPDNTNDPNNWETSTGEVCYKVEPVTPPFVLPANTAGYVYSKVVVKAGSTGNSVTNENAVFTTDMQGGSLTPGDAFVHPEKDSISHVIVCEVPEPLVAGGTINLADATCVSGQSLNVGGFTVTNSSYSVTDDGSGDGTFEVVFTANAGALFPTSVADAAVSLDRTTLTFTGSLSPPNLALCAVATASISVTPATCTTGEQLNPDGFGAGNASLTSSVVEGTSYTVIFTASGDAVFPVVVDGATVSADRKTLTYSGTLAGPDLTLCPGASASIAFTAPNCTTGEQLNPGAFLATAAEVTSSEVVDGAYTVVFTTTGDALFPAVVDGALVSDDRTTLTFTGTLDGPDLTKCPVASATIDFTAPTCTMGELVDEEAFMTDNAELVSNETVGNAYTVVFKTTGTALFPVSVDGAVVSDDRTTLTFTGTLDPENELLCVVVDASFSLPAATCELGADWENPMIDADAGVIAGEPVFDEESQTVSITFTAIGANVFAVEDDGEVAYVKVKTVTLDVAGPNADLCDPPVKVTFCHATPVDQPNKWEIITTSTEAINFIDGHADEHDGDIIPAFDYQVRDKETGELIDMTFEGKNLDTVFFGFTGQEILDNGCEIPLEVVVPSFTVVDEICVSGVLLQGGSISVDTVDGKITYVVTDSEGEVVTDLTDLAPGTYTVTPTAVGDVELDLEGFDGEAIVEPFDGECGSVLPITDATIAFTDATCLDPQGLDIDGFEFDSELAELESVTYHGLDYTVVFVTIGEDTQFFQTDEPVEGRTVSEDGTVLTFTGTLDGPNEELCPDVTVTVPPITVVDTCLEQSYTLTAVEGVTYSVSVNGSLPTAVSFEEGEDTLTFTADPFDEIVVMATADEGYVLAEGYEPFEYTFAFDEECLPTAPVTTASVTWTMPDCLGNPGSYTLTNEAGVIWTVDGVVVAGNTKYTAAVGSSPEIRASLQGASEEFPTGFGWNDADQRTVWDLVFAAAAKCDLPTLALTGASNALGGLGIIAVLIMMAGTGLVVARRREAASIQG